MKKKEAILKAIGVYLGANALSFGVAWIMWLVFTSPVGRWLELNKPTEPSVPGSFLLLQFIPIMIAITYYRNKVKSN